MEDLKIYKEYVSLIDYTYLITKKFPTKEKYNLVNEIKIITLKGVELIINGQKCYDSKGKIKYLNELDSQLKILKVLIRVSYKQKYIKSNNYTAWSKKITNIGNLLGAWIKSCLKP